MMRLGFNALRASNFLPLSLLCARKLHSSSRDQKRTAVVSEVGKSAISAYSNIYTQKGDKVFVHAYLPHGKITEKRMNFIKLYLHASYLTGNNSVYLSDLTALCNKNRYKPVKKNGQKGGNVESGNLKSSLQSNLTKNLFYIHQDEDNKTLVSLTDKGIQDSQRLAESLNVPSVEEPKGRLREVLIIFKKEGWAQIDDPISIKKLCLACSKHGYNVESGNLRSLLSAQLARNLFIIDRSRDTVMLTPIGLETTKAIEEG